MGFTLVELLISLSILGVIATFTIPKIIVAQQSQASNAAAHEAASMIAAAYQQYTSSGNAISSSTTGGVFTQYMNYVALNTSTLIDDIPSYNLSYDCSSGSICLKLHSGGTLFFLNSWSFGGTATTNALPIFYDPDGTRVGGTADGPSKAIAFYLYTTGRITSIAQVASGTVYSGGAVAQRSDPSWYS